MFVVSGVCNAVVQSGAYGFDGRQWGRVFMSVTGVGVGTNGNNGNTITFRERGCITTNNPSNNSNKENNGVMFRTSSDLTALSSFECGEGCGTPDNRSNENTERGNGGNRSLVVHIPHNAMVHRMADKAVVTSVSASRPFVTTGNNGNK